MLWRVVIWHRMGAGGCLTTVSRGRSEGKAGGGGTGPRVDGGVRLCVETRVRIIERLGIGLGIGFNVCQRALVEDHTHVLCGRVVEIEAFVGASIDTVGPPAAMRGVHLSGEVPGVSTDDCSEVVAIVGNLEHLDMLGNAELADAAVSVHVASIPVLEGAFFGVVRGPGVEMHEIVGSRAERRRVRSRRKGRGFVQDVGRLVADRSHRRGCRLGRLARLDDAVLLGRVGCRELVRTVADAVAAVGALDGAVCMAGGADCACAGRDRDAGRFYV